MSGHADLIVNKGFAHRARLRESQPKLLAPAKCLVQPRIPADVPDGQTPREPHRGKRIRRRLWRTDRIAGWLDFVGLRQVWVIVAETEHPDGTLDTEHHNRLSSLSLRAFSPDQLLLAARNHWSVENNCFGSLDVLWGEDRRAWCTLRRATECPGLMRMMAENLTQFIRKRHLRRPRPRKGDTVATPWRHVFRLIRTALTRSLVGPQVGRGAFAPGI